MPCMEWRCARTQTAANLDDAGQRTSTTETVLAMPATLCLQGMVMARYGNDRPKFGRNSPCFERARSAERVLLWWEKSEHARPIPTRPDPVTLLRISGTDDQFTSDLFHSMSPFNKFRI